jgi:hypothetical protein
MQSARRDTLAGYIRRKHPDVFLFYAEDVWEHVSDDEGVNALQMEEQLAGLADLLIVVAESAGTFAELGAFSVSAQLRRKLFPIVDRKYSNDRSFLNTGPITWVNRESRFKPAVSCDFDAILLAGAEVDDRILKIPDRGKISSIESKDLSNFPKHLLFLIADLVAVVGPVPTDQLRVIVEGVIGGQTTMDFRSLLGLACTMKLIEFNTVDGLRYYWRPLANGHLESYQTLKRMFDLSLERARFLATLQKLPNGRKILAHVTGC